MKILLIKLKNIGDTLLMTPVAQGIKELYPESHITVLVRQGTESILAGCPAIDEILISAAPEKKKRGFAWWRDLRNLIHIRGTRFDWVFELADNDRGRWATVFSGGKNRITSSYGWPMPRHFRRCFTAFSEQNWQLMHRVEKDYRLISEFLPLPDEIPPLIFDVPEGLDPLVIAGKNYVVIHPVSRWKRKAWPASRWITVGRTLIDKGLACIVSSGPDSAEIALAEEISLALGTEAACTLGRRSWSELARIMRHARLFVGLDTAAMHLAAACQCPIVALFAQSIEHHWHPWKCAYEIVSPGGQLRHDYPEFFVDAEKRSMIDIQEKDVITACEHMLDQKGLPA